MVNILAQLQKLVEEHGSASINRDHIALLSSQLNACQSKKKHLETEINALKAKIDRCEKEKATLEKLTNEPQRTANSEQCEIKEDTKKVLAIFHKTSTSLTKSSIAITLNFDLPTIAYHCDILRENGFIHQATYASVLGDATYEITSKGRKYAVEILEL